MNIPRNFLGSVYGYKHTSNKFLTIIIPLHIVLGLPVGILPIMLEKKLPLSRSTTAVQYVKIPYHRILFETNFNKEFVSLTTKIKNKCPEVLSEGIEVKLGYSWDTSFDKHLYNMKRVLEEINQQFIERNQCNNKICNEFKEKSEYHTEITGNCLNTNKKEVLLEIIRASGKDKMGLHMSKEKLHQGTSLIVSKLETDVKTRPLKAIPRDYFNEVTGNIEEWIKKAAKPIQSTLKQFFKGKTPTEKTLEKLISNFKKRMKRNFKKYLKRNPGKTRHGEERLNRQILSWLQSYLAFIKHDKVAGDTQIMCKYAAKKLAIKSIEEQKRFKILEGDSEEAEELRKQEKYLCEDTSTTAITKDANLMGKSFAQQVCIIFHIDMNYHLVEGKPNESTTNYKSHKDPPLFRCIIGCVNRPNHPNITRVIHDFLNYILEEIQKKYKDWAIKKFISQGVCYYNMINSIQDFIKAIESAGEGKHNLETADLKKCYPNHDINTSTNPEDLEDPTEVYIRQEDNRAMYANKYSTLDLLNQFIAIVFSYAASEMNQQEVVIANQSWRKSDWKFTLKTQMGGGNMIGITKNNLIQIIHKSLNKQHFGLGKMIVEVTNGIIEGQYFYKDPVLLLPDAI